MSEPIINVDRSIVAADVEVIIPAFNAGAFIEETLHSVLAQRLPPRRITVVDDRSIDDTVARVKAVAAAASPFTRIEIRSNEGPPGPSAARNTAIRLSDCAYLAFQDADDVMLPWQLECLVGLLEGDPAAVVAFGDTEVFGAGGTIFSSLLQKSGVVASNAAADDGPAHDLGPHAFERLLRGGIFCTSACLVRTPAVRQAGLFDEEMRHGEDTDLFLRLSTLGGFAWSPRILNRKRVHETNLSHPDHHVAFERGTVRMLAKMLDLATGPGHGLAMPDAKRRMQVRIALEGAASGYLYHASRRGVRSLLGARRDLRSWRIGQPAGGPRHWLRALTADIRGLLSGRSCP